MSSSVASHYAGALAAIVFEPAAGLAAADALAQIVAFEQLLDGSSDLRGVLMTPAITRSRKRAVVASLAGQIGISQLVRNFLLVILDHGRIALLPAIREAFEAAIDRQSGIQAAEVYSAEPLGEGQAEALTAGLSRLCGKQARPHFIVDPSLLGGVLARIGSTVYDGSLRGQIEQMRRRLTTD